MKKSSLVILMTLLASGFSQQCSNSKAEVLRSQVSFKIGTVLVNGKAAKTGTEIKVGDKVETLAFSSATIILGSGIISTLRENTKAVLTKARLEDGARPAFELNLKSGSNLNKVAKGAGSYRVTTLSAVAGVRGTTFGVSIHSSGKTVVDLLEGKIETYPVYKSKVLENKSMILAKANSAVVIGKNISKVPLSNQARRLLKKYSSLNVELYTKDVEKANTAAAAKMKKVLAKIVSNPQTAALPVSEQASAMAQAGAKPSSYAKSSVNEAKLYQELKAKHGGNISIITTKDGKTYKGVFVQKGPKIELFTLDGKYLIHANKIDSISKAE